MKSAIKVKEIHLFESTIKDSAVKAFGSIVLEEAGGGFSITIYNMRIIDGANGLFVGWPSRQTKTGYSDVITIGAEYKGKIEEKLIEMYSNGEVEKLKPARGRDSSKRGNTYGGNKPTPKPESRKPRPEPEPEPEEEESDSVEVASDDDDDIFG